MTAITDLEKLAKKAAQGCHLNFQDGRFMGTDWYELVGDGVEILEELLKKHGDEGLSAFNKAFAPLLEERAEEKVKLHDNEFKALLPRVVGGPYDMREIEELRGRGVDTSKLVTTEDYRATVDVRDAYQEFLAKYRRGELMEVYIPTDAPETFQSEVVKESWARGRLPRGKTIILQKPK